MTDSAIVGENLAVTREVGAELSLEARQRANIVSDGRDFIRFEQTLAAESRHRALTARVVAGTSAMRDRLCNVVELTAPQPFVVDEIGIALGTGATGAMGGRAISLEGADRNRAPFV